MPTLRGTCHCGNIAIALTTSRPAARLALRACACSFCRRHAARTVADPRGRARIEVADPARLSRYSFGLGTADFVICARCGNYAAAVLRRPPRAWATLNANLLPAFEGRAAQRVSYEGESAAGRIARRMQKWTPAELVILRPAAAGRRKGRAAGRKRP